MNPFIRRCPDCKTEFSTTAHAQKRCKTCATEHNRRHRLERMRAKYQPSGRPRGRPKGTPRPDAEPVRRCGYTNAEWLELKAKLIWMLGEIGVEIPRGYLKESQP